LNYKTNTFDSLESWLVLFFLRAVRFSSFLSCPLSRSDVSFLSKVGAPFGLRGTVVAIHHHSGAVECVFDEPFVGGSTLQGSCDKFRGRLLPWNHVLRVPPPPGTPGTAPPAVVIAAAPASAQTTGQAAERGGATKISTVLVGKKNAKGKSTATSAGVAAAADSKQANARPGKGKGGEVKADGKGESAPSKVSTKSKAKKGKDDEKKTEKAPEKSALFDEDDDEDEGSAAGSGGTSASTTSGATAPAVAALFAAAPVAPPAGAAAPAQTKPPLYVALESTVERVSGAGASSVASPRSPTRAPPQEASARQYGVRPEDVEDAEDDVVDDEDGDGSGAIMDDDQGDVFVYDTWDTGDEVNKKNVDQ
jgi:5'-3' exoribonuclease 1